MSKKNCSFCEATVTGTMDELIVLGWAWAVISAPVRKTITSCPKHHKELHEEVAKTIGRKKPVIPNE